MISQEQITAWREEYIHGLSMAIDESAVIIPVDKGSLIEDASSELWKNIKSAFETFSIGKLSLEDPLGIKKLIKNYRELVDSQSKWLAKQVDVKKYYKDVVIQEDYPDDLNSVEGYKNCARWFVLCPLINGLGYVVENHPLVFRERLIKWDGFIDWSAQILNRNQLFDYLHSMTKYGLYKLLFDNKFPYAEDLFNAIQDNNFDAFNTICSDDNVELNNLATIAGYISQGQQFQCIFDDPGTILSKNFYLLGMFEPQVERRNDFFLKEQYQTIVRKLLPFDMTDDETRSVTSLAYEMSTCFDLFEMLDGDELAEINRVLSNPVFTNFMKVAEYVRLSTRTPMPKGTRHYLSSEEQARFIPVFILNAIRETVSKQDEPIQVVGPNIDNNDVKEEDEKEITTEVLRQPDLPAQAAGESTQDIKTLASRWMTEPYHRMSDDVLVEIISQKIWPQLMNEVDNLQWTPNKRALASFQKTKNMLAACLLFHAMELSKIAKLPKQEESGRYDYDGLYGEEDRALADVYTTSNLRAGVTHSKKKYNDTLPVGYMDVIEKIIPESDMPGRTTSRTYLKLLNYWIKTSFESTSEYKTARELLDEERRKSDLGAQCYLFDNNKKRLRAMLKKWWKVLPELFNVPI